MSIYDDIRCIREHTTDAALYEQAEGDLVNLLMMWQKEQEAR